MPRTPLTAEAAYAFANLVIPDDGPLAIFNAIFEIHADALTAEDAEAVAETDDDEASLAAIIGHANLKGSQFCFNQSFAKALPSEALMKTAVEAIDALESGTIEQEAAEQFALNFPTTVAAMAVWHKDGRLWTVLYRHPKIPARLAAAILKEIVDDLHLREEPSDDGVSSKN